jgi:hypothetical protein
VNRELAGLAHAPYPRLRHGLGLLAGLALAGCDLDQRQLSSGDDPLEPSRGSAGSGDTPSANAGSAGSGDDVPDGALTGSGGSGSGAGGSSGNGGTSGGVGVLASVSNDDVLSAARADLASQPTADQRSLRYVALTNRAGASASELDQLRWALAKAVNSLSNEVALVAPTPVTGLAAERVLYRIDLRDYGWARAVELDAGSYSDGWEAIVAASPYAIAYEGEAADALTSAAGTSVPLLFADHLMAAALDGELYYALLAAPSNAAALLSSLGVDLEQSQADGRLTRIATFNPHVATFEENVAERVALPDVVDDGSLWLAYAVGDQNVFDSAFPDPVGFTGTPRLALFSRPNGLFAFAAFDDAGERAAETDFAVDASTSETIGVGAGCMACHGSGPVRMIDELRSFAETFGTDVAALGGLVPAQAELNRIFSADQSAATAASSELGVPDDLDDDPIAEALQRFARAVSLDVAAGELGVTSESLAAALPDLDPALAPLGEGETITRADFALLFRPSACVLQSGAVNRPAAAACAR